MASFTMRFAVNGTAELIKTEGVFQNSKPIHSVRGKTSGAHTGVGTFQWSSAVQALSILVIRTAAQARTSSQCVHAPPLSGGQRSPAASLDYAISKHVNWFAEMFGSDASGELFGKRLFRRSNPERKRPGPVEISINQKQLLPSAIRIYVNDREIDDSSELVELADNIEQQFFKNSDPSKVRNVASHRIVLELKKNDVENAMRHSQLDEFAYQI